MSRWRQQPLYLQILIGVALWSLLVTWAVMLPVAAAILVRG